MSNNQDNVGRVSDSVTRQVMEASVAEEVGLRCANPTYGTDWSNALIDEIKAPIQSSIAIGPFGSKMKSDCYVDDGVRVVRGTNISSGRIFSGNFVFITHEKAKELGGANLQPNDLVFPHRGSIGEVGVVPNDGENYVISSSLMKLTCDTSRALPLFVYYFFKSDVGKFELLKNSSQVGTPGIGQPLTSLKSIRIQLPPLREQKEIAEFLGSVDDRIALLRQTNTTLEAIAQALFKSWFVDFDPVYAKQQGNEPKGMDSDTAALFPDSFEESELGLVPKGWMVGKIDTVLSRLSAKIRYKKDHLTLDGTTPIYEQGAGILLGYHDRAPQYNANVNDPAFIFGDHTCVTHLSCEPFDISQNVIPLKGKDRATLWVYYAVKDKQTFQEYRRHWMELIVKDVVIPPTHICDAFAKTASLYHLKMESNVRQSRSLSMLRDTLLPRLISGQLRLPEAEIVGRVSPQGVTRQIEANMSGYAALTRPTQGHEKADA